MADILKCDLCDANAGNDPYHITFMGDGHVHICAACFDPQQHDVGVLKQQRDELLDALEDLLECPYHIDEATVSKAGLEATMNANPHQVVGNMSVALLRVRKARAAIVKAGGES